MNDSARPVLGYLAAFTLGVICTGVIVFVTSQRPSTPTSVPLADAIVVTEPPPQPRSFQQRLQQRIPTAPAVGLPSPRGGSPAPNWEPVEAPPTEPIEQVEAPQRPTIVPLPPPRAVVRAHVGGESLATVPESGRISGKVRLLHEPPPERRIEILDPACGAKWQKLNIPPFTRFFVTGKDRGLADVVVNLRLESQAGSWSEPRRAHKIITRNCLFEPYISAIQAGQRLTVENGDNVLHNLHFTSERNGEFNRAQLPNSSVKFDFKTREDFARFKCDVHPWEFAYVSVFDHPYYAVTDKNGVFVIQGVPPGKYTLEARHRKAGILLKEIQIDSHRSVEVQFDFETITGEPSPRAGI